MGPPGTLAAVMCPTGQVLQGITADGVPVCVSPFGLTAVCGDGIANGSEACDLADLRGATCQSLGLAQAL